MKQLYKACILALIISFCSLQIKAQTAMSNKIGWATYDNTWSTMENVGILTLGGTTLGIDETKMDVITIAMYPNPVANILHIDASSEIQTVQIYATTGQKVRVVKVDGSKETRVNISALSAQLYYIKIKTAKGVVLEKFIKE